MRQEWFDRIHEHMALEKEISEHFHANRQRRKFREGNLKTSFIYLLIDPRISKNLPVECKVNLYFIRLQQSVGTHTD